MRASRGVKRSGPSGTPRLTEREREVLALVQQGLTNQETARRLRLSPHTVRGYVTRLLARFGAKNRTEMAAKALALRRRQHRRLS